MFNYPLSFSHSHIFKRLISKITSQIPTVYTDGSSVFRQGRRIGGAGVFWGEADPRNVAMPLLHVLDAHGNEIGVTNSNAELTAALIALQKAREIGIKKLRLRTDSKLIVNGMKKWIDQWMEDDWINASGREVLNKRLFLALWLVSRDLNVTWEHVPGHSGVEGNEGAHNLANEGIKIAEQLLKQEVQPKY